LHVVVWLPRLPVTSVPALIAACAQRGVGIYPAAPHYSTPPKCAGFLFGYGLVDVAQFGAGVGRLAGAYQQVIKRSRPRAGTRRHDAPSHPC